ncbi:MAG TPA: 5'-nucleotidase C-terminal domain-containing protein [Polyangiales bacterium]|nr:5'-nucleotidase C-terminal domain-containing protein [Polyangiales bacterium]
MKWLVAALLPACILGCVSAQAEGSRRKPDVTISVVATNDVHGRLTQLPLFGGYVQNLRATRAADGGGVVLLDAGDIFQGTLASNLTEGAAMMRGYRALRYTAAAIGNHEFDFGPLGPACTPGSPEDDPLGALRARIADAGFPLLSSNLMQRDGAPCTGLLPGLRPSILHEVAGVRIGIVGGMTLEALTATHAANTGDLSVAALAPSIEAEARRLRAQGAQLIIALVHAGGDCRQVNDPNDLSSCDPHAEGFALAEALRDSKAVDLIIGGHTHAFVAHRVAGIPMIESGCNGRAFGRVDLTLRASDPRQLAVRIFQPHMLCSDALDQPTCTQEHYEGAPVKRDERVLAAISDDLKRARDAAEAPLGVEITAPLERSSEVESPLSNLVVDLMRRAVPGAHAAFNNPGSVRTSLTPGPLTYGRMFEMFPFENRLASLRMRVSDLARVVLNSLQSDRGLVALSGVRAAAQCRAGQLAVSLSASDGSALPQNRMLTVVTSDYVVASGDGLLAGVNLPAERIRIQTGPTMREALIMGLQSYTKGRIDGGDRRIYDKQRPRLRYTPPRPVQCPGPTVPSVAAQGPT